MSKIGKQPIKLPAAVKVAVEADRVLIKGPGGEMNIPVLAGLKPHLTQESLRFELIADDQQARSNFGTMRSLVANAVLGLTQGFEKVLVVEGVGYRIAKDGSALVLNLGFSHPVRYKTPPGINFELEGNTILKVKGFDKTLVGQVAAEIRALKKPEPYKGKGFRYLNEVIRRKAGKKAVTSGGP